MSQDPLHFYVRGIIISTYTTEDHGKTNRTNARREHKKNLMSIMNFTIGLTTICVTSSKVMERQNLHL